MKNTFKYIILFLSLISVQQLSAKDITQDLISYDLNQPRFKLLKQIFVWNKPFETKVNERYFKMDTVLQYSKDLRKDSNSIYSAYVIAIDHSPMYPEQVLDLADTIRKEAFRQNVPRWILSYYNLMGVICNYRGMFKESAEWFAKGIEYGKDKFQNKANNLIDKYAWTYMYYGNMCINNNDYLLADSLFKKSRQIFNSVKNDDEGEAYINYRLAQVNYLNDTKANTDSLLNRAYFIFDTMNHERGIVHVMNLKANMLLQKGELNKAKTIFTKSKWLSDWYGIRYLLLDNYNKLAKISLVNNPKEAIALTDSAIRIATRIGMRKELADAYEVRSQAFYKIGNFKDAYNYYNRFFLLKDSLFNKEIAKKIGQAEARFESEQILSKVNLEKRAKEQELSIQSQRNLLYLIGLIALSVLLAFAYWQWRKVNIVKKKIEIANAKLAESEDELSQANLAKNKLFSIISHDLRSPIRTITNMLNHFNSNFKTIEPAKQEEIIEQMAATSTYLSLLSDNILNWSYTQLELIETTKTEINLEELINSIEALSKFQLETKSIELIKDLRVSFIDADLNQLDTILRNLISNAIKFTEEGGRINIYSDTNKIEISNTGKLISDENIERILNNEKALITSGTSNETGTGYGLMVAKEFITNHNWKLEISNDGVSIFRIII